MDPVELAFRNHHSRVLAAMVKWLGPESLTIAEDATQSAFVNAVQAWRISGPPSEPYRWLLRTAKNKAIDLLRQFKREQLLETLETTEFEALTAEEPTDGRFGDSELRMFFLCCHPRLNIDTQVVLILNTLAGLTAKEIAQRVRSTESAVAQRIVRAKRTLMESPEGFSLPHSSVEEATVDVVLIALQCIFTIGYEAACHLSRDHSELCDEAILLTNRLVRSPIGDKPRVHALLALMLFQSSRIPARLASVEITRLANFDFQKVDQKRVSRGISHLLLSISGSEISPYHCQAAIASCYSTAKSYETINWQDIAKHHDDLVRLQDTPMNRLNRSIVQAILGDTDSAMTELASLEKSGELKSVLAFHATKGWMLEKMGFAQDAVPHYRSARDLCRTSAQTTFFNSQIQRIQENILLET